MFALASLLGGIIRQAGHGASPLIRRSLLGAGLTLLATPAGAQATAADRLATHAYLQAGYELTRALADGGPQARSAGDALTAKLAAECPRVLAGAPHEEESPLGGAHRLGSAPLSPRRRGEAQRAARQLSTLESELNATVFAQIYAPEHQAIVAYTDTVTRLSWSDPRVAPRVRFEASLFAALFEPAAPANVCDDMRAWVAGGYRTLSPATKEFEAHQAAQLPQAPSGPSIESLLKRYEGPAERALTRRGKPYSARLAATFRYALHAGQQLAAKLGIMNTSSLDIFTPGVIVGRGSTRDGGRFTARVRALHGPHVGRCRDELAVAYQPPSRKSSSSVVFSESGSSRCVSARSAVPHATVNCQEGRLQIESTVLSGTRSVRLLLSDGTSATSGVISIPPRLGGPERVYFQSIRGPSPYPISLSEIDARGTTLAVVKLRAVRHCRRMPSPTPTFRKIVQASTPDGTPFTINGTSVRFPAHPPQFSLSIRAGNEGGILGAQSFGASSSLGVSVAAHNAILAEVGLQAGCAPHPYGIVFGWLKKSGATVLAQTANGLVPLQLARIPAALHAKGVVVYGAFASLPSELIVRAADGSTLLREDLRSRAQEETEFCEGNAEP